MAIVNVRTNLRAIPNATISIFVAGTTVPATTTFTDSTCLSASSTFTADLNGNYFFFANSGKYKIQVSGIGVNTATYDGVNIGPDSVSPSFPGQVKIADGTAAAPSLTFTNNPDRGIYNDTANTGIGFSVGGVQRGSFTPTGLKTTQGFLTGSAGVLGFTGGSFTAALDTGVSRCGILVVCFGNGTATDFSGSIKAATAAFAGGSPTLVQLTDSITSRIWQLRAGGGAGNNAIDLFNASSSLTMIWAGTNEVRIGTATNVAGNSSRMFVFGGTNGANLDLMGDGTVSDQSTVEMEGSDYATHTNSIGVKYGGINALGTTLGFTNVNLGQIFCGGTCANMLLWTGTTAPMIFGTNGVERARLLNGYQFNIGVNTAGSGILGLSGSTSGTATFTAPAVAGTVTNPISVSNSLNLPTGAPLTWNADSGMSRTGVAAFTLGTATQGDFTGTLKLGTLNAVTDIQANGTASVGTGAFVRTASPSFTGTANFASISLTGSIVANLTSSGISINAGTPAVLFNTGAGGGATGTLQASLSPPTSTTITLQMGATDTIVNRATTDTLSNKTIDTAAPNTIKIAGTSLTATTGSGSVVLATSPSITTPTMTSPTVNTGVTQGSGMKHQRFGVSCTTAAAVAAGCDTTYTWTSAFADANYTVVCQGGAAASGQPNIFQTKSVTASNFVISIEAATAVAAQYTNVLCIAMHD